MSAPLFRGSEGERRERRFLLKRLIEHIAAIGATCVEIPCVDASSLRNRQEEDALLAALEEVAPTADRFGIDIALETDLPPQPFRDLLERTGPILFANYDIGNSASLGYDAEQEIAILGDRIRNVHVKDRVRGGTTVPLGEGDADFDAAFRALAAVGYEGDFVLQTARHPDDVDAIRRYQDMLRGWVTAYLEPAV
jgi:hexulose-6-phosphate isomerase